MKMWKSFYSKLIRKRCDHLKKAGKVLILRFDWLKKLANCYGQSFARIRASPEKKKSGEALPV